MRTPATPLAAACLAAALHAAGAGPLPRVEPAALGIDPVALAAAMDRLAAVSGIESAVVVRRGAVVAEAYWVGDAGTLHHLASVTKSVTATLVGIAIARGTVRGTDAGLVALLPPGMRPADPAKGAIRLHHLLTMTSGLDYDEDTEFLDWARSPDPVAYVLSRPLAAVPGSVFSYSSADAHLAAVAAAAATARDLAAFAQTELFRPLGIGSWFWVVDARGYRFGGHGLWLSTEDMARLGVLVLSGGRWAGRQVVPPTWIREMVRSQVRLGATFGPLEAIDYGYLWWPAVASGHRVWVAWGWGGQFVLCVPDLDLVVATTAAWQVGAPRAARQEAAILETVVDGILPAAGPLPPRRPAGRLIPRSAPRARPGAPRRTPAAPGGG